MGSNICFADSGNSFEFLGNQEKTTNDNKSVIKETVEVVAPARVSAERERKTHLLFNTKKKKI